MVETPLDHPYEFNRNGILVNDKLGKIRVYHLQKFNKKSKQIQTIENEKNVTKSEMIRKHPMWICTYYDFPIELLDTTKQNPRNYEWIKRT